MSHFDAFIKVNNIRMKEGESIAVFSNCYLGLLPVGSDQNADYLVHDFVRKLPAEVLAIRMYNNHKSFDEIALECNQVWKVALAHNNKRPRTQVNLV